MIVCFHISTKHVDTALWRESICITIKISRDLNYEEARVFSMLVKSN